VAVGASTNSNVILNETSPYKIGHLDLGYFETKRLAENVVINACKENRLDAVILNPSTIYGPGDARKGSRKIQVKVANGKFPFYTSGGVSVVDVEDVIAGILSAWVKGRTGERYILSGENLTIQDLFGLIAASAKVSPPSIHLPDWLVHLAGISGDLKSSLFGAKGGLSRENAWTSTMYHWFDSTKAKTELDFQSRPAAESIQKSVQWMRENAYIL
jgi:dihydroflavonol-4-reductase